MQSVGYCRMSLTGRNLCVDTPRFLPTLQTHTRFWFRYVAGLLPCNFEVMVWFTEFRGTIAEPVYVLIQI